MVVPIQPGSLDQKKMIRPRWRQILILVIVPLLTGCYVLLNHFIANQRQYVTIVDPGRIVDPKSTGGKKLPGTEDMRIYGEDNFSVSPDGRWLLYYSDTDGTRDRAYRQHPAQLANPTPGFIADEYPASPAEHT